MICLRCGYCCWMHMVMIPKDSNKRIYNTENWECKVSEQRCKYLRGTEPGEMSCAIHDKGWYKNTPCYGHGQIERSTDCKCRLGEYILADSERKEDLRRKLNLLKEE